MIPLVSWFLGLALAHPLEPAAPVTLPAEPRALVTVPLLDGHAALALASNESWMVNPGTGRVVRTLPVGGWDAAVVDIDGDLLRELVLCGDSGLVALPWEGPLASGQVQLTTTPCTPIEAWSQPNAGFATVSGALHLWSVTAGVATDKGPIGPALSGKPFLASLATGDSAGGSYVAATSDGSNVLVDHGPSGLSTFGTGGAVSGLAAGPRGFTWALPGRSWVTDVTRTVVPVAPEPIAVAAGTLDKNSVRDIVVLHRDGTVGVLPDGNGPEQRLEGASGIRAIAVDDLDGNACADVLMLGEGSQLIWWRSAACDVAPVVITEPVIAPTVVTPVVVEPIAPLPPVRKTRLMGVPVPAFIGDQGKGSDKVGYSLFGFGVVAGGTLGRLRMQIPAFVAGSVEWEIGRANARAFLGLDTAPLFLWITQGGGGIHLANFSAGGTFGGRRLRTGPFVTAGLLNYGGGLRTVWTPWDGRRGGQWGIEGRLTYFAPRTGEAMFLVVLSNPNRKTRRLASQPTVATAPREPAPIVPSAATPEPTTTPAEASTNPEPTHSTVTEEPPAEPVTPMGAFTVRRAGIGVGVAGAVSSTRYSWEFVGSDKLLSFRFSPAFSLSFETGKGYVAPYISMQTAPAVSYLTPDDARVHHLGSLTLGVMLGSDAFRAGPIGTAGFWELGGGARIAVTPFTTRDGGHHGLDLRAYYLWPSAPAFEGLILYTVTMDPRR